MMRNVLVSLIVLVFLGCASQSETSGRFFSGSTTAEGSSTKPETSAGESGVDEVLPVPGKKKTFEDAGMGFAGPEAKEYRCFYTYDDLLEYVNPDDLFVDIDFSTQMILACFMGEKATGGYMNMIQRIEEGESIITVYVEIIEPGEGDIVAQMVTFPWYAAVLEKSDKDLEWIDVREGL